MEYTKGQTGKRKSDGATVIFDGTNWILGDRLPDMSDPVAVDGDVDGDGRVSGMEDFRSGVQAGLRTGVGGMATVGNLLNVPGHIARGALGMVGIGGGVTDMPDAQAEIDKIWDGAADAIGAHKVRSDYQPYTTAGQYAKTASEFLPGAVVPGGGTLATRAGAALAAGVTSEAAGKAAANLLPDNPTAETIARLGGALTGPAVAQRGVNALTQAKGTAAQQAAAEKLRRMGVAITGGQATGSTKGLAIEAATDRGQELIENSYRTYSKVALDKALAPVRGFINTTGMSGPTDEAIDISLKRVGNLMDDLAANNHLDVTKKLVDDLDDIVALQSRLVNANAKTPLFKTIRDMLDGIGFIDGKQFQNFRTELRTVAEGGGPDAKLAAKAFTAITDAMEDQLRRSGDETTLRAYRAARQSFRDLKTLEDAFSRGQAAGTGNITPQTLGSAMKTKDGAGSFLRDDASTFSELVRAGRKGMRPVVTSMTADHQNASRAANLAMPGGVGGAVGFAVAGPSGVVPGAVLGALAPSFRNHAYASKPVQNFLKNPPMSKLPHAFRADLSSSSVKGGPIASGVSAQLAPWWENLDEKRKKKR